MMPKPHNDVEFKSRGYEITLTDKQTGQIIRLTLNHDRTKWIVSAERFTGYYGTLETALREALSRARDNLKGEE